MSMSNIQFRTRIFVEGTLTALTGLHIGGNSVEMSIGGADKIVVRDPLTNRPYIPGSSLRGKMRSLMERMRGEMTMDLEGGPSGMRQAHTLEQLAESLTMGARVKAAKPATLPTQIAAKLFGVAIDRQDADAAIPQRLIVRDAHLLNHEALENARNTDMPYTEVKTEVAIDRITSKANPRQMERVPAGAAFGFQFVLTLYGEDDQREYLNTLFQCMELLQDDYLGGHGGRGYGKVLFHIAALSQKTLEDYRENKPPQAMETEIPVSLIAVIPPQDQP